jgi:hypothetical protein
MLSNPVSAGYLCKPILHTYFKYCVQIYMIYPVHIVHICIYITVQPKPEFKNKYL